MEIKSSEEFALLIAQAGPLLGQRWALNNDLLIGRDATCDIVVSDRQVSRHHARFTVLKNKTMIEDLGSKNGTHRNGHRINEKVQLEDGDEIQIALAQKFIFLSSDATVPLDTQDTDIQLMIHTPSANTRLRLEKRSRRVWITVAANDQAEKEVEILPPLSASQFRLLEMLYENQGRVVTRADLIAAVWGEKQAYDISEQALDALVRRLRDRINSADNTHNYVVTVRGHGLRLDNPSI